MLFIEIKTKQCENLKLNIVLQIRVESVFYCILFLQNNLVYKKFKFIQVYTSLYKFIQNNLFSKSTKINTDTYNSAIHFMPLTKK